VDAGVLTPLQIIDETKIATVAFHSFQQKIAVTGPRRALAKRTKSGVWGNLRLPASGHRLYEEPGAAPEVIICR